MAELVITDNAGRSFVLNTETNTRTEVSGAALTAAVEELGSPLTNLNQLPSTVRATFSARQRELESKLGVDLGGAISLDVRLGFRDAPRTPLEQVETTGPSFFEQARLLFPFIPNELVSVFAESWERFGSTDLALAQMRQDPRYDRIFPGIKREDGSVRMTEAEYLSTVDGYKRRLGQFGVPPETVLTPEKQAALISGDVSAQEFGQRLNQAFTGIISNIEPVREFFAANFGAGQLSDAAIFASALDPGKSPLEFQREIEQAQIGGEAALRGFDVARAEVERLESFGLDQVAARRLFGQAQEQLPRLNQLLERFNDPDDEVSLSEFSDAVVIADPNQLRQFERLFRRSTSGFSRVGGAAQNRLGAFAGLLEQ